MPVPVGLLKPEVAAYLQEIEDRLSAIEAPAGPVPAWPVLEADLPSAADFINRAVLVTDLKVLAVSDGADWIRQDDGSAI